MPTSTEPEVSAEQQAKLLATGNLFHALAADPRYRKEVLSLIKKAAPDTPIPELDMESAVLRSVEERLKPTSENWDKLTQRLDTFEKKLSRDSWQAQHQLNDDEAVEVEALAKTAQIGDGAAAVELWRSRQATLGTPRGTRKNAPGTEDYLKKLSLVNPTDSKRLKVLVEEEAHRIFNTAQRKAS
jgi:hypothetical protein